MRTQYQPKTFLRQTSNHLLQTFFSYQHALFEVPWEHLAEHQVDEIYQTWQRLPEPQRLEIERTFEEVEALSNPDGLKSIIDEGFFHGLDLAPVLEPLANFRDKALQTAIKHPKVFQVAGTIHRAHSLSKRYWRHRGQMPSVQPDVSPEGINRFRDVISGYFRKYEGRGQHCTVDPYLRVNRYHYFFAYPDNYADTYMGHDDEGHFIRRPQRPAFEIVFLYDPVEATLDVYAQGGKDIQRAMQNLFCQTLLREDLPPEAMVRHPYELNVLKSRQFLMKCRDTDPADGIEEIKIRQLRLSLFDEREGRIVLEADPDAGPGAIYEMIDECLNRHNVRDDQFHITHAQFHFQFVQTSHGRQRTLTFDVTHPNTSNLKSCRHEDLRLIGEKYLRRWGIDRAVCSDETHAVPRAEDHFDQPAITHAGATQC